MGECSYFEIHRVAQMENIIQIMNHTSILIDRNYFIFLADIFLPFWCHLFGVIARVFNEYHVVTRSVANWPCFILEETASSHNFYNAHRCIIYCILWLAWLNSKHIIWTWIDSKLSNVNQLWAIGSQIYRVLATIYFTNKWLISIL